MNDHDHAMIAHATRRGRVLVDGVPATLIAWKPRESKTSRRHERKARVDFGGRRRTVHVDSITLPEAAA